MASSRPPYWHINYWFKRLEIDGYYPIPLTNCLFAHRRLPTKFALCVDNFGIKYNSEQYLQHLVTTFKKYYNIFINKEGRNYCGLTFDWHYKEGFVDISMPGYVPKALDQFNHPSPIWPQYAPHTWSRPNYGQKVQYAQPADETKQLDGKGQRRVQAIVGKFLYYGRAIDPTVLTALGGVSISQAAPTIATNKKTNMLMDYLHTFPNAKLQFYAGDMQLHIESDAAYLVIPGACSHTAGHFYLSAANRPNKVYAGQFNTPLHTECRTIKNVVSSAAEAECVALFHNCMTAVGIWHALQGLGHPQARTEVITDNSTANSFVHSEMRVKRSKSWDMRYNWLRNRLV